MSLATTAAREAPPIHYPERDGKPMGETDVHREEMIAAIEALKEHFRTDAEVYVAGNLMFYYEEGNPAASVSPDAFVVKGVRKGRRRIYKLWEEGRAPDVVFEFSSRSTRLEDLGTKRALYAILGVKEYFLFDPLEEYLEPPMQGFRLKGREYEPIALEEDGTLISRELGLRLSREDSHLSLTDLRTGRALLTPEELAARLREEEAAHREAETARQQAERQATTERTARLEAERRVEDLAAELERLRARLEGK